MSATLIPFEKLQPGDRVRITQRVKVGMKTWSTHVTGTVERAERRRNGLHVKRNSDDKVYSDLLVLRKDGGDETTVVLDEFTHIERA